MTKTPLAFVFVALALAGCSKDSTLVDVGGGNRMARLSVTENPGNEVARNVAVRLTAGSDQYEAITDDNGVAEFDNIGRTHNSFSVSVHDDCYATAGNYTFEAATGLSMAIGDIQVRRRGNLRLTNGTGEVYKIWLNGAFEGYLGPGAFLEKYNVPTELNFVAEEDTWFFPDEFNYTIMVTHCRTSWMTNHTF
jgi:hypothetical protein